MHLLNSGVSSTILLSLRSMLRGKGYLRGAVSETWKGRA